MADAFAQIPPQSTGLKIDTSELTVNAQTVERQRINLADPTTDVALAAVAASTPAGTEYGLLVRQTGPATITGSVTANIGTSGNLALDATLTGGTQKTKVVDSAGTNALSVSAAGAAKVDGSAVTQPVSGTVTANQGTAGAAAWKVDGSAVTQPVSAASLPLPTGAATAANQSTIATSVGSIDTKTATAVTSDYDTGAGTQTTQMVGLALPASGGAVAGGTATNPIRVDVTGTTTQPVSAASLPLPTGAATAAKQPAIGTAGTASADVISVQGVASMTALKTDGSGVTQPVSAAALPLPTGASTAAKQPAVGTAGAASADVITIQGVASMTAVKVDGSAVTQPVSLASVPSHAVTNAGTFAVQAASAGDVASGSSDSGNPVKAGAVAHTAAPTAVTDGQRVNVVADKVGRLVVVPAIRDLVGMQTTQIASSSSETTVVTAVASTFLDLTHLSLTNATATAVTATLKDSTAGTTRAVYNLAASGGIVVNFNPPLPQGTVNNNWTVTLSSAAVTVSVNAVYVKNI